MLSFPTDRKGGKNLCPSHIMGKFSSSVSLIIDTIKLNKLGHYNYKIKGKIENKHWNHKEIIINRYCVVIINLFAPYS